MLEGSEKEVMSTPDRSRAGQTETSISKFEDSPIFSFINSLSPVKPLKSTHTTQTINALNFASLPSVFTSPQAISLRESRFLQKPQHSSVDGIKVDASKKLDEQKENMDPRASDCEMIAKSVVECSWNPSTLASFPEEASQRSSVKLEGVAPCAWKSLIANTSDLLTIQSQNEMECNKKPVDPSMSFFARIKDAVQNLHSAGSVVPGDQGVGSEPNSLSAWLGEGIETVENASGHESEKIDYEQLPDFYRGIRKRCLVFDKTKHLEESSGSNCSLLLQSEGHTFSNQQLVPLKNGNDGSHCALRGIGLHLNTLAPIANGYKIMNHEASASGSGSGSVNLLSQTSGQVFLNSALAELFERKTDVADYTVLPVESGHMLNEEINPKKKRRRFSQAGDGESCKRCNCKKSKCLKLYCECFAAGVYCTEPCACVDCFNKPIHEDTVLATRKQIESRNPLAFAPKVIRGSDPASTPRDEFSKTPASARHKRGCNCKKSGCLKKYCECYQGGVGCSINCRCEGCKNTFGRKNGMDTESEEDEMDVLDRAVHRTTKIRNNVDHSMDSAPPATPLRTGSNQPDHPCTKPPGYSLPSIISSSSFFPPLPKFMQELQTVREEDRMPEFLQGGSGSSVLGGGGVNSSSPNRKRVSPPQRLGMAAGVVAGGLRSSRKLILHSIPSFPSLTSNQ